MVPRLELCPRRLENHEFEWVDIFCINDYFPFLSYNIHTPARDVSILQLPGSKTHTTDHTALCVIVDTSVANQYLCGHQLHIAFPNASKVAICNLKKNFYF